MIARRGCSVTSARDEVPPTQSLPSILNGKDFAGWKVPNQSSYWNVVDGVLVGQSDDRKLTSMLYTEQAYGDVIIEAEVRFTGEIDSGEARSASVTPPAHKRAATPSGGQKDHAGLGSASICRSISSALAQPER